MSEELEQTEDTVVDKEKRLIFDELVKPEKKKVILANDIALLIHKIKEDICSEKGFRVEKDGSLDLKRVPSKVLLAAINKHYELDEKNKFETEYDLYEEILDGIKSEKFQVSYMNSYAEKMRLKKEAGTESNESKKYLQEKVESCDIEEEESNLMQIAAKLFIENFKKKEGEKLNKDLGKEPTKPKDLSSQESIDVAALETLIKELGLENQLTIKN